MRGLAMSCASCRRAPSRCPRERAPASHRARAERRGRGSRGRSGNGACDENRSSALRANTSEHHSTNATRSRGRASRPSACRSIRRCRGCRRGRRVAPFGVASICAFAASSARASAPALRRPRSRQNSAACDSSSSQFRLQSVDEAILRDHDPYVTIRHDERIARRRRARIDGNIRRAGLEDSEHRGDAVQAKLEQVLEGFLVLDARAEQEGATQKSHAKRVIGRYPLVVAIPHPPSVASNHGAPVKNLHRGPELEPGQPVVVGDCIRIVLEPHQLSLLSPLELRQLGIESAYVDQILVVATLQLCEVALVQLGDPEAR